MYARLLKRIHYIESGDGTVVTGAKYARVHTCVYSKYDVRRMITCGRIGPESVSSDISIYGTNDDDDDAFRMLCNIVWRRI